MAGGCDLVSFLDNLKCKLLDISLSNEETRPLVRSMESHVEEVDLGVGVDVSLDITGLTQYSGRGKDAFLGVDHDSIAMHYVISILALKSGKLLFIKIYFGKDTTGIKLEKDNIYSLCTEQ